MNLAKNYWSDQKMERIMGNLLQVGVVIAATIILWGGFIYLIRHGAAHPSYRVFRGEPADLRTLRGIWGDVLSFRGRGIIQLGILLLIGTPIARVTFSVYAFARQRDWIYVCFTLIVFGMLIYSLAGTI
jgi:uncharacterized membrane protein